LSESPRSGWWPGPGAQLGLTAVELMVVLAIVAILGFAVYPWLSNVRGVLMVKGAPENVAGAIRMARQLAITQGSNHCIEFGSSQYRIRQADTTPLCNGAVVSGYDTSPASCLNTIIVTLYGGVRVAGC
jgi:prepilin-type N-terminal cleavage/methylation domain-containing protein